MTLPATAQVKTSPIEMDASGWGLPISAPITTQDLRPRPGSEPPRLRCWQRGVLVLDELLAESTAAQPGPAGPSPGLRALTADGRQLLLLSLGESLCVATVLPRVRTGAGTLAPAMAD